MKGLTYSRCGDYYIPDLKLSEQAGTPIGKYGRMRKRYLEKHRPIFYNNLILTGRLYPHLLEIDKAANERMDTLMPQLMEAAGVDEALKAADQIRWVGLMNTLKAQAEETILSELIFDEGANKMLSFDRILQVFDDILRQDPLYEVVSTSHGYTLLGWEPNREEWYSVLLLDTPEVMLDTLIDAYSSYVEEQITNGERDLNEQEIQELDARCQELREKCLQDK